MKSIDFTKPGGFPLTQDQLGYLQEAYTESIGALAAIGGSGATPYIISGIVISNPSIGTYSITDGWFFYNGEMVRCLSGSVVGASGALAPFIVINPESSSLVFNNGSTPDVIFDKSATIVVLPSSTATDATHFPLSSLQKFGSSLGNNNREEVWSFLEVDTPAVDGGVVGNIYYKKDYISNTLHLRGLLTANNAQNFAGSPGTMLYLMGTLPSAYIPSNSVYFSTYYFVGTSVKDDVGVSWIKQVNCVVNVAGQVLINWIKPEVGVGAYGVNFNVVIPLG